MYNIKLISTHHSELGKCNADELHKIFEAIRPDVIFEEIPPYLFNILYQLNERPDEPTESKAVKRYLQTHDIKHIPVDIDTNQDFYNRDFKYMCASFEKHAAYKKIEDEQKEMIITNGFPFLNSKECIELLEKRMTLEKTLIELSPDKNQLLRIHKLLYEETDNREHAMLQNIYNYSKQHIYSKAIFMLGSAHRKPIMQKIQEYESKENFKLNWTFYR